MIILHDPKLIFLKSGKVAGTSFEIALSKYADESSIITPITSKDEEIRRRLGFRGPQNFRAGLAEITSMPKSQVVKTLWKGRWPAKYYNHISPKEVRQALGEAAWQRYAKIGIIRDPFDYAISCFFWQNKNGNKSNFEEWCLDNERIFIEKSDKYYIDGKEIVDFYIKYDSFEKDVLDLEGRYPRLKGLWECFSSIWAKSGFRPKEASIEEMFKGAPQARSLISKICHEEIRRFNFQEP